MPAAFLNSTLDYDSYLCTANRVRTGEIKLLYTSPETLVRPETRVLLDRARVACLAIDEAHCISQWGHDFRPEYRQLRPIRARYRDAVCVAFTATATQRVQADVKTTLGFRDENTFIASYNRKNLFLEVRPRSNGPAQTIAFLEAHRDQSGIIYCSTRRGWMSWRPACKRKAGPSCRTTRGWMTQPGGATRSFSHAIRSRSSSPRSPSAWGSTSPTCASCFTTTSRRAWSITTRRSAGRAAMGCGPIACCCSAGADLITRSGVDR